MESSPADRGPVPSERARVRRLPARACYQRAVVDAILDEAIVSHLGTVRDGAPVVIPTLHARVGDDVYVHGSSASASLRALHDGVPACLSVALVDGLVLARSVFHHSVNYRAVVVHGRAEAVTGEDEKRQALEAFSEQIAPGRWDEARRPSAQELKATAVLRIPLTEASAKLREGPPLDDEPDYESDCWAGVVPLSVERGSPVADPRLRPGIEPSPAALRIAAS